MKEHIHEEQVDIVDSEDEVLYCVGRSEMRQKRLRHRAVFIVISDGQGRILVHRRSGQKDIWPNWCDIAVGGVVGNGEDYESAADRELLEEIGITNAELLALDAGRVQAYSDDQVSLLGRCFLVISRGPFSFSDGEVVEAWWVDRQDLDALLLHEQFLPDSLALLVPYMPLIFAV